MKFIKWRWRLSLRTQSTDGSPEWLGIPSLMAESEDNAFHMIYKKDTSSAASAVETTYSHVEEKNLSHDSSLFKDGAHWKVWWTQECICSYPPWEGPRSWTLLFSPLRAHSCSLFSLLSYQNIRFRKIHLTNFYLNWEISLVSVYLTVWGRISNRLASLPCSKNDHNRQ